MTLMKEATRIINLKTPLDRTISIKVVQLIRNMKGLNMRNTNRRTRASTGEKTILDQIIR